jgi:hypothetical protein
MSSLSIRSWLLAVFFVLVSIAQVMAGGFNTNLVVNGDAESVPAANQSVIQFDGWVLDGSVSIRAYGSGSFPGINSPGPTSRGNNFFYGGSATTALAYQAIDLSFAATEIDAGTASFSLAAWIGGYSSNSDSAAVSIIFGDANGNPVGGITPTLGPVTPADRNNTTQLLSRTQTGTVPVGSRLVLVAMAFNRQDGADNDGYVDGVTLLLSASNGSTGTSSSSGTFDVTTAYKPNASACPARLNSDLSVQIPRFHILGAAYSGSLQLKQTNSGGFSALVTGIGNPGQDNCASNDIAVVIEHNNSYLLHVPSLAIGASNYWANLVLVPTTDGTTSLDVTGYGTSFAHLTGEGSAYLSLAKIDNATKTATGFSFRRIFDGGTESQVSVTLTPDQAYTPTAVEAALVADLGIQTYGATVSNVTTADTHTFKLQYVVPYSVLPAATVAQLRSASPVTKTMARAGESSNLKVFVEAETKGVGKDVAERVAKKFAGEAGEGLVKSAGSVMDFIDALEAKEDYDDLVKRMGVARRCIKANVDATLRQQYLDKVEANRTEIKLNTANNFLGTVSAGTLDLLLKEVPGVFVLTSAATGFIGDAMKSVNEQLVRENESVGGTKCDIQWLVNFDGSGTYDGEGPVMEYSSTYKKIHAAFTWKTKRGIVTFKDNVRGQQSPNYGSEHASSNHVIDIKTIEGTFSRFKKFEDGSSETCEGTLTMAAGWDNTDISITDSQGTPYPPTPEFNAKVPGFTSIAWAGTCSRSTGGSYPGSGTLSLMTTAKVEAAFGMPSDFRSGTFEQQVGKSDTLTDMNGYRKTQTWTGTVKFIETAGG